MSDIVTKLRNYFNLFDGTSKSLVEHRDVIDAVIDEKIRFVTPKGEIDHAQFIERIRNTSRQWNKDRSPGDEDS